MKKALLVALVFALVLPGFAAAESYIVLANQGKLNQGLAGDLAALGGTVTAYLPEIDVLIVESSDAGFAAAASAVSGIQGVHADFEMQLVPTDEGALGMSIAEAAANPPSSGDDDILFDLQWGHDAVDAPEAWDLGYRGAGVRVAVLDSGIDHDHPDFPNLNHALSASFVPGEDWRVSPGFYFNHGTHVAGTIGAADNGVGTIGVAPEVELVAVKVLSEFTGSGSFGSIIQGIVYAASIDADIINMSLGADIPHNVPGAAGLFAATNRAVNFAHQQGTTIIVAAGNSARDLDHDASLKSFPAELPHVLAISSTAPIGWAVDFSTSLDHLSSFSNYGQSAIDFAAPGGDGVYPGNELCAVLVVRPCWVFDLVFSTISGGWGWSAGTSMAAPHAAGVAALIIGKNGGDMHPSQVRAALAQGADDLGKPGQDDAYGAGRVNALGSVD